MSTPGETAGETVESAREMLPDNSFLIQYPHVSRVVRSLFLTAFVAFGIGAFMGVLQALHRTGIARLVPSTDYYTLLTLHGVLLVIVFTIFFLAGVFTWANTRSLDRPPVSKRFTWFWVVMMSVGTAMTGISIFAGLIPASDISADVLFTFYAPLQAHPLFYIGLAVFVIGTWLAGIDWFRQYLAWRRENAGERIPLQSFMVLTTMLMWFIATMGVAVEVVVFLIPWSLGLMPAPNPLLTRTLFWFFGHPVVYFWLMPAYLLWYTVLPKIAGGRLFSDPLARVVFVLFLLLSTPVGIHHQYLDPGIAEGFKFIAMTNTMFLLLPSLLTAFTVVASIEHGARQRGGTGYFGWLKALPWRDPAFTGMGLAGLMFAAGGFSGMVNAGMNINYLVHNTLWVPGHFHLTVGTAVGLTFMAGSYWLVPRITGRKLYSRPIGLFQVVLWFIGMVFMSAAMHRGGLAGIPRRTAEPQYPQVTFETVAGSVGSLRLQLAFGGVLLFVSALLFLMNIGLTAMNNKPARGLDSALPPALSGPDQSPTVLDNLKLWALIAIVLVVLAYSLPLYSIVQGAGLYPEGIEASPAVVAPLLEVIA